MIKMLYGSCSWSTALSTSILPYNKMANGLFVFLVCVGADWVDTLLNFIYFQSNALHKLGFSQLPEPITKLYIPFSLLHHSAIDLNDTSHLEGYINCISFCVLFWNKLLHSYLNWICFECAESHDILFLFFSHIIYFLIGV